MGNLTFKPASGGDLILQNDDAGAKIQLNNDDTIDITGSIDTGTFNGTIGNSATVTPGNYSSSLTFSTSIPNNTLTTVYALGSQMSTNDSATILLSVSGWELNARVHVLKDQAGYKVELDPQKIAYVGAVGMSGDNFQVNLSLSAGNHTVRGRVYIHKGY